MMPIVVRVIVPILIVASGVGAMLALGSRHQETQPPADRQEILQVEATAVLPHRGELDIQLDGIVSPFREIEVAAEVAGRITTKSDACQAGAYVRQGTLLVVIDPRDYQLEIERSQWQIEQAQAELEESDVDIANTQALIQLAEQDVQLQKNELDRLLRLAGNISQSEVDQTRRAVLAAENVRQTLENQLRSTRVRRGRLQISEQLADAQLRKAQLDLERSQIVAPVDGVIVRDSVEQGSFVQKGSLLFVIEDTASIEVRSDLRMEDLYWLWRQQAGGTQPESTAPMAYQVPRTRATVLYEFAGREGLRFAWSGVLDRFNGIGLDERTRTVPCRIIVDQPRQVTPLGRPGGSGPMPATGPPALVRGMYVTVVLHVQPDEEFVRIPDEALQPGKKVWVVRDGRLEQLGPLALIRGSTDTDEQGRPRRFWLAPEVESGLKVGDQLVITPLQGARPGMAVALQTAS